ncbi:MAG TPA: DNA methyltransferase [Bacteroidota bacterium]|nr:DNA methyltransferase [Bacteroidota bacterium]
MAQKAKKKVTPAKRPVTPHMDLKQFSVNELVRELNSFSVDNYWDLGRFLVDKVMPAARKAGMFEDQVLKMVSSHPGVKFPFTMLKQCEQYYSYYPDVKKRPLPEVFYFDLATKVDETRRRDHYEKMALDFKWTISDLRKKIHDDDLARRIDERTKYGFDLRERNVWAFDTPDPRFGKANYKGRIPGQIVANALYYYTKPGDYVIDPFAGSGTLGDLIETLPHFKDRRYKLYDANPLEEKIARNNVLLTGIPEQTGSVDYIFLDPPTDFVQRDGASDFAVSLDASRADFALKFKGIIRECARILKSGGKVSIVMEPAFSITEFIDFPHEVTQLFKESGFKHVGKVYLPRRSGEVVNRANQNVAEVRGIRALASDCRELLTFQKS